MKIRVLHAGDVNDDDIVGILDNLCGCTGREWRENFHDDFVDYMMNDYEVKGAAWPEGEP